MRYWIILLGVVVGLAGCAIADPPASTPTSSPATRQPTRVPTATFRPAESPVTPTHKPIDYAPLIDQIDDYAFHAFVGEKFDLSVGYVDMVSGQSADYDGKTRHFALSTFKGPLAAYYLWLVQQGDLSPQLGDVEHIVPMLAESSNIDTSCVIKRVGGLAGFNDWLAETGGLARENNFVARWTGWGCREGDAPTTLIDPDMRYLTGDKTLGLPGGYQLAHCYPTFSCAEAFAPVELAMFYTRLYQGEILDADNLDQWLTWMEKAPEDSALARDLPTNVDLKIYVKNGFSHQDEKTPLNFQHEAGIIVTPYGAYALAIFTQGNDSWPGTEPLSIVGRMVYDEFMRQHGPQTGQ
jgi:hypothetical protein